MYDEAYMICRNIEEVMDMFSSIIYCTVFLSSSYNSSENISITSSMFLQII